MIHWDQIRSHHNSKPGMDEAVFLLGPRVLFGSRGIVGCSIERLGVLGDETVVLFILNPSQDLESVPLLPHFLVA